MTILQFKEFKKTGKKISMVTCYDYTSACITNSSEIDALLVGDSLAMTMLGEKSTLPATLDQMCTHIRSVVRGAPNKFVIGDMPFLSFRKSLSDNMNAVEKIMQAGAHAVKLEGLAGNENLISHIVESGVPVMGHLGLTPQSVNQLGGYRVQGREEKAADILFQNALALEECGAFAVVLECVPTPVAAKITQHLKIPTIGIGAGAETDGQVLVWQDLLGMNTEFKPKFVRTYLNGAALIQNALNQFNVDVKTQKFPSVQESYE